MNLQKLSFLTLTLFVVSLGVYFQENKRGTDLVSGSEYIKGLNLDTIKKITIESRDGGGDKGQLKTLALKRDGELFYIESDKSYPAETDLVNELIYKLASIEVSEKVKDKSSVKYQENFHLTPEKMSYRVTFYDDTDKKTLSFRVGKRFKNFGNYLMKESTGDIYLSKSHVFVGTKSSDYIDKKLLKFNVDNIIKFSQNFGPKLSLEKSGADYVTTNMSEEGPAKKLETSKITNFFSSLGNLKFTEFYKHSEDIVRSLVFDQHVDILLENKVSYRVSLSKRESEKSGSGKNESEKDYFLKVSAHFDKLPKQITVGQGTDKKELKKIEDVLMAQSKAERFNLLKGGWVYKITQDTYKTFLNN